jgi:hypothetical protein
MTDDLSLDDATVSAQLAEREPVDPWHARRAMTFGASEVPALVVGLGTLGDWVGYVGTPGYLLDKAKLFPSPIGMVPRIILEKAGVRAPLKVGKAAAAGTRRERELLLAWKAEVDAGLHPDADGVDVGSIRHADAAPKEWFPLVDRECPSLAVTPDAWCRDMFGANVGVELKCSTYAADVLPGWWLDQKQAQIAACAEDWGIVVQGVDWSAGWKKDGPVRSWRVDRDDARITLIRDVCRRGWEMVEAIRKTVSK